MYKNTRRASTWQIKTSKNPTCIQKCLHCMYLAFTSQFIIGKRRQCKTVTMRRGGVACCGRLELKILHGSTIGSRKGLRHEYLFCCKFVLKAECGLVSITCDKSKLSAIHTLKPDAPELPIVKLTPKPQMTQMVLTAWYL